jgi:hypothetical protein
MQFCEQPSRCPIDHNDLYTTPTLQYLHVPTNSTDFVQFGI